MDILLIKYDVIFTEFESIELTVLSRSATAV